MALYAFNGTWNEDAPEQTGETGKDTNVVKFRDAYEGKTFYVDGVGTRFGIVGRLFGGIAGFGGRSRVKKAINAAKENIAAGDKAIDVVGFSRGAALALHFVNEVQDKLNGAPVRFLGLFDTVASFGIPGNMINPGWKLEVPPNVARCCHAMALDERRHNFPLTRACERHGRPLPDGCIEELWFRGVHSDIGGGKNLGLTSIAITWMLERAIAAGVPVREESLKKHKALWGPDELISHNLDFVLGPFRSVNPTDKLHPSVRFRPAHGQLAYNNPPQLDQGGVVRA